MATVGILVFDDVEVLDFAGPYEVFSMAARCAEVRDRGETLPEAAATLETVGPAEQVTCRGGLVVRPTRLTGEEPFYDVLIVPGGPGARSGAALLARYVARLFERGATVASVCTGAFVLAEAGLLDGRRATTHHRSLADLASRYPAVTVTGGRVVDEGRVLTAGGVSCGVDLALHLVRRLWGPEVARFAVEIMEWPEPGPKEESVSRRRPGGR